MKKGLLIILILCCAVLSINIAQNYIADINVVSITDNKLGQNKLLFCPNYDRVRFEQSIEESQQVALPPGQIYGGIVPHHLTADNLIAEFFESIVNTQSEIVILVGPNHPGLGVKTIHTSIWDWDTAYGTLENNFELTNYLIDNGLADTNFELLVNEHSITALVPYIKYFMPDTEIVPIILSSAVSKNEAVELGERIYNQVKDKNFIVISSVDFSHYLTLEEADKKDEITKDAVLNRDINKISLFNNDYLDSPASIIVLLTMINEAGSKEQFILNHTNSSRILEEYSESITSYFTIIYQ